MKVLSIMSLVSALFLAACASVPVEPAKWNLEPFSLYDSGYEQGTEIISVQPSTLRAVLSNFESGEVDLLDVSHPQKLHRSARFSLGVSKGEELTSVAFHPALDLFAAVIDAGNRPGRLEIRSASTGVLVDRVEVGFGPDAVVYSQSGNFLMIANEGEDFLFEPTNKHFFSPEGSVSIVRLSPSGQILNHKNLDLANMINYEGFVITQGGHFMEREIDWNGDGVISKEMDFDDNGVIEKKKVLLGQFEGRDVFGTETKGERKILIPIKTCSPALLEPEYVAIAPDAGRAYVTLQENDGVAVIDIINEQAVRYFGLGAARHKTDTHAEGWIKFDQDMTGLREPDGIAVIADGRYFVTADEGDTESEGDKAGQALAGGRTISVFDAKTGDLVGDTGNQLDEIAFAHGMYSDLRSTRKGSEPEMLVSFDLEGTPWLAVGMERAGAVVLISVADPKQPKVVALGKIPGDEGKSPEGIAHFEVSGEHYLLTANEMSGTVACFKITKEAETPAPSKDADNVR